MPINAEVMAHSKFTYRSDTFVDGFVVPAVGFGEE
jgi:hypothetical protein